MNKLSKHIVFLVYHNYAIKAPKTQIQGPFAGGTLRPGRVCIGQQPPIGSPTIPVLVL